MLIHIAGHDVELAGDPNDTYFAAAEEHAKGFDDLVAKLARAPKNSVVFDVGANIGLSTIAMAMSRPDVRIFSFEPSPANIEFLRRNTVDLLNVTIINAAVSNEPSTLRFHTSEFAAGSHVVGINHMVEQMPTITVSAMRLDDFAAGSGLYPSFIKLDVEGHEPEVLAGASKLLSSSRPWIYLEFNSWTLNAFAGHSPSSFATALFKAFDVEGWDDPLTFLHSNLTLDRCVTDVLMRLKEGQTVPKLSEMSYPAGIRDKVTKLYKVILSEQDRLVMSRGQRMPMSDIHDQNGRQATAYAWEYEGRIVYLHYDEPL